MGRENRRWWGAAFLVSLAVLVFWAFLRWEAPSVEQWSTGPEVTSVPAWGRPSFLSAPITDIEVIYDYDSGEVLGKAVCETGCGCFSHPTVDRKGRLTEAAPRNFGPKGWWPEEDIREAHDRGVTGGREVFLDAGGGGYAIIADCQSGRFEFWGRVD